MSSLSFPEGLGECLGNAGNRCAPHDGAASETELCTFEQHFLNKFPKKLSRRVAARQRRGFRARAVCSILPGGCAFHTYASALAQLHTANAASE
jgi:hypothetical protein